MNIERPWWLMGGMSILTFASAFGLSYYAGSWPLGPRSIASVLIFFFCLVGLQRSVRVAIRRCSYYLLA